ncbi:hypothetical protein [Schaalia sp. ZJ405]|uniref:hypothetical protein n=1 Tax=Schaalia sp. ZJ405 TaxID=2709403 RepID=UPI001E62B4CF|nr:hypothetical protein [Schaalia sp. ZJ405]
MNCQATPAPAPNPEPAAKSIDGLSYEVIKGKWGNGDERRRRLGNLYGQVHARVNAKLDY